MASLFNEQADLSAQTEPSYLSQSYAQSRPTYPSQLFHFLAANTPRHRLAWDAGAGTGQATAGLAAIFDEVVATDASAEQLAQAPAIGNVRYQRTPPVMSDGDLAQLVADEGSVDLVTVAQAVHWFDLASFYKHVKWVLRKPGGVLAVWCCTGPLVDGAVDTVLGRLYYGTAAPFFAPTREMVHDEYRSLDFPFDPLDGAEHTGPFTFEAAKDMDLETYFSYIRSWSAYHTAKEKGVELLTEEVVGEFERAWGDDKQCVKRVVFPLHLRIGKVRA